MEPAESDMLKDVAAVPQQITGAGSEPQYPRERLEHNRQEDKTQIEKKLVSGAYAAFATQGVYLEPDDLEWILAKHNFPSSEVVSDLADELNRRRQLQLDEKYKD